MKFKKAIILYNIHAGQGNIREDLKSVALDLENLADDVDYYESLEKGDIEKKCAELWDYDLLISVGGDGTFNELINGCYKNNLTATLGLLPGGSFNDFSKTLGLSPNFFDTAALLKECEVKEYDAILSNDRVAINFWAIGLPVENAKNVEHEKKEKAGILAYIPAIIETLKNHHLFKYEIIVDEKTYTGKASMIFIANGHYAGGMKIPLTDLKPNDGILHLFVTSSLNLGILNDFGGEKDTENFNEESDYTKLISGQKIEIRKPDHKEIDMDGEIIETTPSHISILQKQFKILTYLKNK